MPVSSLFSTRRRRLARDPEGVTRLSLVGECDLAVAPDLDAALREAQAESRDVVVDLRWLSFLDCTCLHTLLVADACVRRAGGRLTIESPSSAVSRLLLLTGRADCLTIVEDVLAGRLTSEPGTARMPLMSPTRSPNA